MFRNVPIVDRIAKIRASNDSGPGPRLVVPDSPQTPDPGGVVRLEGLIADNARRREEIAGELAHCEVVYNGAALRWDVDQDLSARADMNGAAARRRELLSERAELLDDAQRLENRLQAARLEYRRLQHFGDLAALDELIAEFPTLHENYVRAALELVECAQELFGQRIKTDVLRSRCEDYARAFGGPPPAGLPPEAAMPRFSAAWLTMSNGVEDCKRGMNAG